MSKYYKLNEEIKQFIIEQKKSNPKASCRGLTLLIKERFQVTLSKSLINNVIKEHNLSGPVGRRRVREPEAVKAPSETKVIEKEGEVMENGGFFLLKAADLKLGLTSRLAELLSAYFPGLSKERHQAFIEALIYTPFFREKKSICLLIGSEVLEGDLAQYTQQLNQVPLAQLKDSIVKEDINCKFNYINDLWQGGLLRLHSYILHFFPPEYQFLDFPAVQERFYCLPGRLEKRGGLLIIQLFYPSSFFWLNDIIWLEGFSCAANRVNDAKILTPEKEQIWINPQVQFP